MSIGHLSPKHLFSLTHSPPRLSILIAHFSSSSPSSSSPSYFSSSQHSYSSSRRNHEEESRNVRVSVWWDFENCNIPAGVNVFKVAQTISAAVRTSGIKGPVTITAFGDFLQLSRANQEALSSTGINLIHVPQGGKNSADRSLLVDLMFWVAQNPPPAHLFLISGDRDFATILHRLRMNNYNILLATLESAPGVLSSASSIMWDWYTLIRGVSLSGKRFNQPPDGPYGSWYGHYKGPLEDPFLSEEFYESNSDSKLRPVPKVVIKQIRQILSSNPEGIFIEDLRAELARRGVMIDKDFYGRKRLSRFLLSLSDVMELQRADNGQFIVRGVSSKVNEPVESVPTISIESNHKHRDQQPSVASNGDSMFITRDAGCKSKSTQEARVPLNDMNVKSDSVRPENNEREPSLVVGQDSKVIGQPASKDQVGPKIEHDSGKVTILIAEEIGNEIAKSADKDLMDLKEEHDHPCKDGFLAKLKRLWFGSDLDSSQNELSSDNLDGSQIIDEPNNVSEKEKVEEQNAKAASPSSSLNNIDSPQDVKISHEEGNCKTEKSSGFFSQILNWFRLQGEKSNITNLSDRSSENSSSQRNAIFSKDFFWIDMKSFINSPRGSVVVSQSKTREEMAQNLLKEGPSDLKTLTRAETLALVGMLISDKKWVEESSSRTLPFKVAQSIQKDSKLGQSRTTNGLRSVFMSTKSHTDGQGQTGNESERKSQNGAHIGVSVTTIDKKHLERERSEIFSDCQKLVKQILKEHPEGYNMGTFRKDFLEKYGYHLDVQKLGYQKLQSLLQIFPGVRIQSCFIIPSSMFTEDNGLKTRLDTELASQSRRDDDSDAQFEELGPVSSTVSRENEHQVATSTKFEEMQAKRFPDYEPLVSDDEFSDSEGESPTRHTEKKKKQDMNNDDSSLLQILDSWYSSKDTDDDKEKSEGGRLDSSLDDPGPSHVSRLGNKTETSPGSYGKKQKPAKTYTFVSESGNDNKGKLIDGILGSLKKSSESRMQG